ncbi:MAG: response regulator [Candidatus Magnetomorum sp.]|nr:response regulator [Candidatus Magnetomorum sp.]
MLKEEINRIDRITEAVYYLSKGQVPPKINCKNDDNDEINQLSEMMNTLIGQFDGIKKSIVPLASGNLNITIPKDNFLASPFKQLHSSLSHLTWQTQQIAMGDFEQRVDFMGDFSQAFNTMTNALKESQEQLMLEVDKFKQLAELKNNYLNIMAHDIRTPIGAVMGFSDILLENELPDQAREYILTIKRNCSYLLNLINNILDMAKLEKRKMELESIPFSLQTFGDDIGQLIAPKLAKNTKYIFDCDPALPQMVMGDPNRLRQVLINLLGNSAKFTQEGSIALIVKTMSQNGDDYTIRLSVKDTGIGIAQENLSKLFKPFSQENNSISSKYGGTGLGLSISKEIVELMGGTIHIESTLGKGTEFYFEIVLKEAFEQKDDQQKSFYNNCNILVVDDNQNILDIASHKLDKRHIKFSVCNDSTKVYDLLLDTVASKTPFTLAMLDIDMPRLNGIELAEKIKSHPKLHNLRLVAFTSHTEVLTRTINPKLFSLIAAKPLSEPMLQRIIDEANYSFEDQQAFCSLINKKILVVDDNAINRFIVKSLLQKQEMLVDEAENGQVSIQKINENTYDFVLMDHLMPVMDGIQSIEEIRKNSDHNNLRILAYTANDDPEDIALFLSKGANGIVKKPVDNENMISELCSVQNK